MSGPAATPQSSLPARALNVSADGRAPEWIELIPAGSPVTGVDGRAWTNPDPAAVIAATDLSHRALALDWEHAGEVRAPQGLDAPAAAWIEALEVREGAIWGRAAWTPRAAEQVANREYRYVSPVFEFDRPTGRIARLVSAGLTNAPNLRLRALNRQEPSLDLITRLRQALGLAADAGEDAVVAAAATARAANASSIDLTRYAPRSELETAINRANGLQTDIDRRDSEALTARIAAALDKAQTEGRITPASRPEYLAMCKAQGGLESFERLAATLPVIVSPKPIVAGRAASGGDNPAGLTDEQRAVCRALGQTEAEFAKSLKVEA